MALSLSSFHFIKKRVIRLRSSHKKPEAREETHDEGNGTTLDDSSPLGIACLPERTTARGAKIERFLGSTASVTGGEDTRRDDGGSNNLGLNGGGEGLRCKGRVGAVLTVKHNEGELRGFDGDAANAVGALDSLDALLSLETAIGAVLVSHGLASPGKIKLIGGRARRGGEVFDLNGRWGSGWLASATASNAELDVEVVGTAWVGDVVEEGNLDGLSVLVDGVAFVRNS